MRARVLPLFLGLVGLALLTIAPPIAATSRLPARLTDAEFWNLVETVSEPNGFFRSENLTSNELWFQRVIPDLVAQTEPGGVYLGVGPEQNFTYLAAMRPAIGFIFDIRRGNLLLHLMYKVVFELAADRVQFITTLFSRRPRNPVRADATAAELFSAFSDSAPDEELFKVNLKKIEDSLIVGHRFPLSEEDLQGIEYVHHAFYVGGFSVSGWPTYADLMIESDQHGTSRSYLASETTYAAVKKLESDNLVVPIVGDFAGTKAVRAVAGVRQAERDAGQRPGLTTEERQRLKQLERENFELKRANEILKKASAYFAQAELDRRAK